MATNKTKVVDIDPMAILKEQRKQESIEKKTRLIGRNKSYCKHCKQDKSIEFFDVYKAKQGTYRIRLYCISCGKKYKRNPPKKKSYSEDAKVREWVKNAAERACKMLSTSYIKRLYCQLGYKFKDVTPEMVETKRREIQKKRENAKNEVSKKKSSTGVYSKIERDQLRSTYIKGLIKSSSKYKGEEITEVMIEQRRQKIIAQRIIKDQKLKRKKNSNQTYQFFVPKDIN